MSRPVAIPVGSTLVLDVVCQRYDLVFAGCSEHKITRNYSRVIFSSGRMIWTKFMGPYRPCEGSKCKLHEHVHCRNKKWEGEAEVFWCKHPFVVQRKQRSKDKPKTLQSAFVDLFQGSTLATYQDAMNVKFMSAFRHHLRFFSSTVARCTSPVKPSASPSSSLWLCVNVSES